jgi:hypothetical protein
MVDRLSFSSLDYAAKTTRMKREVSHQSPDHMNM